MSITILTNRIKNAKILSINIKEKDMGTMMYGYCYDRGIRVGYNISFGDFVLYEVSSKDKSRIVSEIKKAGYSKNEISIERVEI